MYICQQSSDKHLGGAKDREKKLDRNKIKQVVKAHLGGMPQKTPKGPLSPIIYPLLVSMMGDKALIPIPCLKEAVFCPFLCAVYMSPTLILFWQFSSNAGLT